MDVNKRIKFKYTMLIFYIYLIGWCISYIFLLEHKGKNCDVWDVLVFIPLLSVGSWVMIIYLIGYKMQE